MQIKGERERVGGQREHGVKVDTNIRREGKSWRPERAWNKGLTKIYRETGEGLEAVN